MLVATTPSLTRFAWLSIAAACLTIALKAGAYLITGSVGLLSDALESLVNLVAAVVALAALTVATREPHEEHAYGYEKVEYLSSGTEGSLILVAAVSIIVTASERLLNPAPIVELGWGLTISVVASLINLGVALRLREAGKAYDSITLEADAQHLMTDVWTSAGVVIGVGLVVLTGWLWLDPLVALAVAANIIWSGIQLVRRSIRGLLDAAIPAPERTAVQAILERYRAHGIQWHAVRTRQAGRRRFVSLHVLVPGDWTVQHGYDVLEEIEHDIRAALGTTTVFTHLEPLEDPRAIEDIGLDRHATPDAADRSGAAKQDANRSGTNGR
jgi:cation diffusion facilitator family transporter